MGGEKAREGRKRRTNAFLTHSQAVQVIVQSRQGRKIATRSNPHGNDWVSVSTDIDLWYRFTDSVLCFTVCSCFSEKTFNCEIQIKSSSSHIDKSSLSPHHYITSLPTSMQFNLSILDDKQVAMELKRSLEGRLPAAGRPVCVEILMDTSEVRQESVLFAFSRRIVRETTLVCTHSTRQRQIRQLNCTQDNSFFLEKGKKSCPRWDSNP